MTGHSRTFRARGPALETNAAIGRSLIFYAVTYAVGVGIGVCLFVSLPTPLRNVLQAHLQSAFAGGLAIRAAGLTTSYQDAAVSVGIVLILWLLGQSPIGGGLATIIVFLRAASLGMGLSLVPAVYGWRGAGFDLLAVVPWNILTAGACIVAGSAAGLYARRVRKERGEQFSVRLYMLYCAVHLLCVTVVLCGGWLEATTVNRVATLFSLSSP